MQIKYAVGAAEYLISDLPENGVVGHDMMAFMAKPPKKAQASVELVTDAWPKFERFIKGIVKAGPQHRAPKAKTRPASKGRVHKGKTR